MKLVYDSESIEVFYYEKSERFYQLANYLNVCKYILECPTKDTIDTGPFPPTDENYQIFSNMTKLNEDECSIDLNPNPFAPIFTDEINEEFDEIIDIKNEESEDFKRSDADSLEFAIYFEYIKQGERIIENINFNDYKSFDILSDLCLIISCLYGGYTAHIFVWPYLSNIKRMDTIAHLTTGKAYELIGYWKAKMEEKRRNFRNTKSKTHSTIENAIKDLLKKHDFRADKDFIIQAQQKVDRDQRTVKNILKSKNMIDYIKKNTNK